MARLVINGKPFDLSDKPVTIGRGPENVIVLDDKESSRNHCRVEKDDTSFKVVDLLSRNGTKVNGASVNVQRLKEGDTIQIGKTVITFELSSRPLPAATPARRPEPSDGPTLKTTSSIARKEPLPETVDQVTITSKRGPVESTEQQLLRYIIVGGGAFIFIILLVVVIQTLTSGHSPAPEPPKSSPTPKPSNPVPTPATAEEKAWRELLAFYNANTSDFENVVKRVDEFRSRFPQTKYERELDDLPRKSAEARLAADQQTLDSLKPVIDDHLKENRYAEAIRLLDTFTGNRKDSPQRREAEARRNVAISNGVKFFAKEHARIEALVREKKYADARNAGRTLLNLLGNGALADFNVQIQVITKELENIEALERRRN